MQQGSRYRGPATIAQGDRRAEVDCSYEVVQMDNIRAWRGEFAEASPAEEPEPGEAELRLGGGKVGQIIVSQVFSGTGHGWFEGTGQPPG